MPWFWQAFFLIIFCVPLIILFAYAAWDVVRRSDIGLWLKLLWLVGFCVLPVVGPLVYLAIRPPGTTAQERALAESGPGRTSELEALADLHDRGKLTDEEFERAKGQYVGPAAPTPSSVREQRGGQLL